jgi:putative ABC transport system permease protein
MLFTRLAIRNLFRQKIRSFIALGAIIFGVLSLILAGGFIQWIFDAMRRDTIYSLLGHIQIAKPGYFEEGQGDPFAYLLAEDSEYLGNFSAIQDVKLITNRLRFAGIISREEATVSFLAEGVEPEKESELSRHLTISAGDNLASKNPLGVILGEGLAKSLGVTTGDTVALLVNTASGGINAIECRVAGVFYTLSKAYDEVALRIPIETARKLLRVSGSHTWILLLNDTDKTNSVLKELTARISLEKPKLQFKPWYELADFYNKTVALYSRQMNVVKLIIALIVILSISNTMMMNILERTGEIGTLMAMGTKRKRILQLFLNEGLLLGGAGGGIGIVLGSAAAAIISWVGIPMPPAPGMSHGFTAGIIVTPMLILQAFTLAVAATTVASLYPAFRAARLEIVDALRHNR